jgi:hypothetical protein
MQNITKTKEFSFLKELSIRLLTNILAIELKTILFNRINYVKYIDFSKVLLNQLLHIFPRLYAN